MKPNMCRRAIDALMQRRASARSDAAHDRATRDHAERLARGRWRQWRRHAAGLASSRTLIRLTPAHRFDGGQEIP